MNLFIKFSVIGVLICLSILAQNCQQANNKKISTQSFYSTGEIEHDISMKDSMLHGISTTYYRDGSTKYVKEFYNDIPIDGHYYYSADGNLRGYNFYNIRGELRYQVLWDSLKGAYSQDGKSLYLQGEFKQTYKIGDSISLIPIVANPFKSRYIVNFTLVENEITSSYEDDDESSPLLIYPIKEGVNIIQIKSTIFDEKNNDFKSDSISLEIVGNNQTLK